ncbi:cysteine-rich receptor-like protein kinase 2 isoform X3 [Carya illinoinensis]|uniref:cysteine-rich receptor-like protein kinase 2 isoform X3 n=1 Tax=Carya illinoinensis TaxID=32201 RepID=UPI001C7271B9|nr:cysteine-rich receptor-like protein kinase 2 isoform X3 [Carya illinoinensis]
MKQEYPSVPCQCVTLLVIKILLLLETAVLGDPRSQTVSITCGLQLEHNSTIFVPNFVATMERISEQMRVSGFGVAVTGSGPDSNFGLAQCYGDLPLLDCVLCYAEARTVLPQCFPYNGGRIYLDGCFMRSENYSFFEEYKGPGDRAVCGNTTRKNSTFVASVRKAVRHAVETAPSNKGYGRAHVAVPVAVNESAYVLADCWRNLNASSCKVCLDNASASMLECLPWSEGRALNTGCFMRYSDKDFLNKEPGNGNSRVTTIVIVVSVVSSVIVLVVVIAIGVYIRKRRYIQKKRRGSNDAEKLVKILNDSSLNFKYSTIEKATGAFDNANKLGKGGFGTVYKGILPDGREIAVKRLFFNNRHRVADFYNEVNIISSVEHKNLVRLLGCSCSGPESLLIYEFMPNKSLDRFIFDANRDFGLARTFEEDKSHISTAIAGTLGYMAPEYLAHGQLTEKADVYSFGVLVLEIVTGKQNNRSKTSEYLDSLVTITWKHFQSGTVEDLYDSNLMLHNHHNSNIKNEILRVVHIGLLCTQEIPSLRPTMSKALQMLTKEEEHLPKPTNPPFVDETTMELNNTCEDSFYHPKAGMSDSIATVSKSSFRPR